MSNLEGTAPQSPAALAPQAAPPTQPQVVRIDAAGTNAILSDRDKKISALEAQNSELSTQIASYRTAEGKLQQDKISNQITELTEHFQKQNADVRAELHKARVLRDFPDLDKGFEDRVVGSTPEDIRASAQAVYEQQQAMEQRMMERFQAQQTATAPAPPTEAPTDEPPASDAPVDSLVANLPPELKAIVEAAQGIVAASQTGSEVPQTLEPGVSNTTPGHGFDRIDMLKPAGRASVQGADVGASPGLPPQSASGKSQFDPKVIRGMDAKTWEQVGPAVRKQAEAELNRSLGL